MKCYYWNIIIFIIFTDNSGVFYNGNFTSTNVYLNLRNLKYELCEWMKTLIIWQTIYDKQRIFLWLSTSPR